MLTNGPRAVLPGDRVIFSCQGTVTFPTLQRSDVVAGALVGRVEWDYFVNHLGCADEVERLVDVGFVVRDGFAVTTNNVFVFQAFWSRDPDSITEANPLADYVLVSPARRA